MTDKNTLNEKELEKVNGGFDSPTLPERKDRNERPGISEVTGWTPEGAEWTSEIPEQTKPGTYRVYYAVTSNDDKQE